MGEYLGLSNLWITFNGYLSRHRSHDDDLFVQGDGGLYGVCSRAAEDENRILVVASAGNTAGIRQKVCSDCNNIRLLLSVPYDNIGALWFEEPLNPCVKLICCEKGGDYFDAIHLSNLALQMSGIFMPRAALKCGTPRRHGYDRAVSCDDHRTDSRLLFPSGR